MAATTYLEAIRQGMCEEMERDERVFMLGEDIGEVRRRVQGDRRACSTSSASDAGHRHADLRVGHRRRGRRHGACMGLRPVCEMQFIDFISCAFDQITNYAAKSRYRWGVGVPMVVRGPCGGDVHGGPFHSQNPEADFVHTPGLKIVHAGHGLRREGPDQGRDPRRGPGALLRAQVPVPPHQGGAAGGRLHRADRQGRAAPRRARTSRSSPTAPCCTWRSRRPRRWRRRIELEVIDLRSLLPLDIDDGDGLGEEDQRAASSCTRTR